MSWDFEWDKYPKATHYDCVNMHYYEFLINCGLVNLYNKFYKEGKSERVYILKDSAKRFIKRPKQEDKVMNMIGKISGKDWSEAPADATHLYKGYSICKWKKDIDFENNCCLRWDGYWAEQTGLAFLEYYISKEEDLGIMNTFSINDLKTGMRITCANNDQYMVLLNTAHVWGKDVAVKVGNAEYNFVSDLDFTNNKTKNDFIRVLKVEKPKYIAQLFAGKGIEWETVWEYKEPNKELDELNEAIKAHEKSLEELKAKAKQLGNK